MLRVEILVTGDLELKVWAMFTVTLEMKVEVLVMVALELAESGGPGYSLPL